MDPTYGQGDQTGTRITAHLGYDQRSAIGRVFDVAYLDRTGMKEEIVRL